MEEFKSGIRLNPETLGIYVKFGGKIKIGCGDMNGSEVVAFQELEKQVNVGDKHGEDWDYKAPTVYFMFDNIKSVELVEEALQIVKEKLNNKND